MYLTKRILLLFLLIAICKISVFSQNDNYIYSNQFVGLSFIIPEDWHLLSDSEKDDIFNNRDNGQEKDNNEVSPLYSQVPGLVLLAARENPDEEKILGLKRSITIVAINARNSSNELTGNDFLESAKQEFKQSIHKFIVSPVFDLTFGNENFSGLFIKDSTDTMLEIFQFAKIHNDYLIVITLTDYLSEISEEFIKNTSENLRLFSVSDDVDLSEEGIAFRKNSTLEKEKFTLRDLGPNAPWIALIVVMGLIGGFFRLFDKKEK